MAVGLQEEEAWTPFGHGVCTRPSGESSVQQRLRLWGHARPGPEEEGKDVGRVLVREEADPWRNF